MNVPSPTYSLVIPIYNEAAVIPQLIPRVQKFIAGLDGDVEVILVDDGSSDSSYELLLNAHRLDSQFKILRFSRNFGHQIAITAGMDYASGQAVIVMDADLQDPPEVVSEMIARWKAGYEIVYAVRRKRYGEGRFKLWTAKLFYRILQRFTDVRMPLDVGDFRLVDRKALNAFKDMRERHRYVRGMFSWIGFKQIGVWYDRPQRAAGETKYPFIKMVNLALNGIISFSNIPLRLVLTLGLLVSLASFVVGLVTIILKLTGVATFPGWVSLIALLSFLSGAQLLVLGIIGEYIGRIYDETKGRPLYVISERQGL